MPWSKTSPERSLNLACALAVALVLSSGGCARPPASDEGPETVALLRSESPPPPPAPPFPRPGQLLRVDLGAQGGFELFVDPASIAIEPDDTVRYTAVAQSAAGAKNVSFEALRCRSHERRVYHLGHPDGTWSPARNPRWVSAAAGAAGQLYATLATYYLCPQRRAVRTTQEAIRAIRLRGHPDAITRP
jgi:hypothetical protein